MAKYLVTSGSHFTPFTYDELVRPLQQMTEAHQATSENLSKLADDSAVLAQYVDDDETKQILQNYLNRLSDLQDQLYTNGYNLAASRNLTDARRTYASDITGLAAAAKSREEQSKAYWDMKHNHPDVVLGKDPGEYTLSNYYRHPEFGKNWYAYSGNDFTSEVEGEAKAAASDMLRSPDIEKDPRAVGYLRFIESNGFTNTQVDDAIRLVKDRIKDPSNANKSNDLGTNMLADILMRHVESSGAYNNPDVSDTELNRLVDYGAAGLRRAVGKTNIEYKSDLAWANEQENIRAAIKKGSGSSGNAFKSPFTSSREVRGANYDSWVKDKQQYFSSLTPSNAIPVRNRVTGQNEVISDNVRATDLVYGRDIRDRYAAQLGGIDVGRDVKVASNTGVGDVTGQLADGTRLMVQRKGFNYVVTKQLSNGLWQPVKSLTDIYNSGRKEYLTNYQYYQGTALKKYAISPDKEYDLRQMYNIADDVPLSEFVQTAERDANNQERAAVTSYSLFQPGPNGEKLNKSLSASALVNLPTDARSIKSGKYSFHEVKNDTTNEVAKKGTDPAELFEYDNNGYISNIIDINHDSNLAAQGKVKVVLRDKKGKIKKYIVDAGVFGDDVAREFAPDNMQILNALVDLRDHPDSFDEGTQKYKEFVAMYGVDPISLYKAYDENGTRMLSKYIADLMPSVSGIAYNTGQQHVYKVSGLSGDWE